MATSYPTSKQTFTDPVATSTQNSPSHSALHTNINDTTEALQDAIGYTGAFEFADHHLSNLTGTTALNISLVSDTDSTDDIGSSSKYFANGYFDKVYFNATSAISGGTAGCAMVTGNMGILSHLSVGASAAPTASQLLCVNEVLTLTGGNIQVGIYATPTFTPDTSSTCINDQIAIGGYGAPTSTYWGAGSRFGGLSFGNFGGAFNATGNSATKWIGTASFGGGSYGGTLIGSDFSGIRTVSFDNNMQVLMGGATMSNVLKASNAYGIYIYGISSLGTGGYLTNNYNLFVENVLVGTNRYQAVLDGSSTGSGLWIGGTAGKRLYTDGTDVYLTGLGSAAAAVDLNYVSATGKINYESSSIRFKENIQPLNINGYNFLNIIPKSFQYKTSKDKDAGFIAEELVEAGMPEAVGYDELGEPAYLKKYILIAYLLDIAKRLDKRIRELEAKCGL